MNAVKIADAESVLAAALMAQGRQSEAEVLLLSSLDTLRPLGHLRARATARRLLRLSEAGGRNDRATAQRALLARIDAEIVTQLARLLPATTRAR